MQITIEDISPVEKRVEFELPWTEVAPRLDKAYDALRREVHLRGFRPGKAPRPVLERLYRSSVEDDVARELVEMSLGQAIKDKQIEPVAAPTVDKLEMKAGAPFKFAARIEVRSQVVPKDYSGIALSRRPPKITEEEVDKAVEAYRRQLTEFLPVEGRTVASDTDVLVVEVHGKVGEHKVKKNSVMVDLADEGGGPLPGLAQRLRGVALDGGPQEIKYRIADDEKVKDLAGKEVSLRVTIKEARVRKEPAIDDEMAKDTGEADTLAGLKDKIRDKLRETDGQRIRREMIAALVKEVVKRNPFAIAPALVDRHADAIISRAKTQLMMSGIDVEAGGGLDEAKMKKDFQGEAEEEARATVLIQAIAEREGVQVSDADVQKRIAELAAARQENAKKLRAELESNQRIHGLKMQLLEEKTLDMLLAQAKITDEDPDRMIITPNEAKGGSERLVLTPEEAKAEHLAPSAAAKPKRK